MKIILILAVCAVAATAFWLLRSRQPLLTFPADENGDVLRRMQAAGDNLSLARDIDFSFVFATQTEAQQFVAEVRSPEYQAKSSAYPERQMWQAQVTHRMVPTHSGIAELEARLAAAAAKYGGKADGWGSFSQR